MVGFSHDAATAKSAFVDNNASLEAIFNAIYNTPTAIPWFIPGFMSLTISDGILVRYIDCVQPTVLTAF